MADVIRPEHHPKKPTVILVSMHPMLIEAIVEGEIEEMKKAPPREFRLVSHIEGDMWSWVVHGDYQSRFKALSLARSNTKQHYPHQYEVYDDNGQKVVRYD